MQTRDRRRNPRCVMLDSIPKSERTNMAESRSSIVTGASGGIGRAIAKRLASDGYAVAVHYAGNGERGKSPAAEIKAAGGKAIPVEADVAKPEDVQRLFQATVSAFG